MHFICDILSNFQGILFLAFIVRHIDRISGTVKPALSDMQLRQILCRIRQALRLHSVKLMEKTKFYDEYKIRFHIVHVTSNTGFRLCRFRCTFIYFAYFNELELCDEILI